MMSQMNRYGTITLLILVSVFLIGCGRRGKPTGTVSGTVTFDGKPYTDASVIFFSPATGQGGSANINPDGTFQLPKPIEVGEYIVYLAPRLEENPAAEPKPVSIDSTVPEKYWSESTSDIRCEIKAGANQVPVELRR